MNVPIKVLFSIIARHSRRHSCGRQQNLADPLSNPSPRNSGPSCWIQRVVPTRFNQTHDSTTFVGFLIVRYGYSTRDRQSATCQAGRFAELDRLSVAIIGDGVHPNTTYPLRRRTPRSEHPTREPRNANKRLSCACPLCDLKWIQSFRYHIISLEVRPHELWIASMADKQHLAWLREGVAAWNQRRANIPFRPDLSNIDLAPRSGASVSERFAMDQSSPLLNFDGYFDLSGIDLSYGFLARLIADSLISRESDFTNSILTWARLRDADLWRSKFDNAKLPGADLSRADLTGTRLWTADLFTTRAQLDYSSPPELSTTVIRCIPDLMIVLNELKDLYADYTDIDTVTHYFRGHKSQCFNLAPTLMREDSVHRRRLLRAFESPILTDLMARHPERFSEATSAFDRLVLARQHGLPTRLLDVTKNPLVALYFACEDRDDTQDAEFHVFAVPRTLIKPFHSEAVSVIANFTRLSRGEQNWLLTKRKSDTDEDNDVPPEFHIPNQTSWYGYRDILARLCVAITEEKPGFENRIDPRDLFSVFVVEPRQSFDRIRLQSGAFLMSAFHERFERSEITKRSAGIPIYHHYVLNVPNSCKRALMEDLRRLNVTREALFPSLDESARAIESRYVNYGLQERRPWTIEPDLHDLDALEALLESPEMSDKWH